MRKELKYFLYVVTILGFLVFAGSVHSFPAFVRGTHRFLFFSKGVPSVEST